MLESAQAAAGPVLLLGVTVLTSLDAAALFEIGEGSLAPADLVLRRARLAAACGLGGLVCSPR
jgi:orotidine-5'-phosphate decarboxylase